jgi:hypothetical protein
MEDMGTQDIDGIELGLAKSVTGLSKNKLERFTLVEIQALGYD